MNEMSEEGGEPQFSSATSPELAERVKKNINSLIIRRRLNRWGNVLFPVLLTCVAYEEFFIPPPPNVPAIGWNAHRLINVLLLTLGGTTFLLNRRKIRLTEERLYHWASTGELEKVLGQLWMENPEQRKVLREIATHFGVRLDVDSHA